MAWKHLEAPKVVKCTKALAKRFAEMEACHGDRNFKPKTAGVIATAINDGRMRMAAFASCLCKEDGKEYRVNGKHTSSILSQLNGHFPTDLMATVERYEADTLRDVANLYATFDPRTSARNTYDINKSFAACHPELAEIPCKFVNICVTGLAFSLWENNYHTRPIEVRAKLIVENANFVLWFYLLNEGSTNKHRHILRSPVAAAAFRMFAKNQKQCNEFWEAVRDGSGASHKSADRVLNKYLLSTSVKTGAGARTPKEQDDQRAMFVRCIHAWNAWRDGASTDLKYYASAKTPAVK